MRITETVTASMAIITTMRMVLRMSSSSQCSVVLCQAEPGTERHRGAEQDRRHFGDIGQHDQPVF